jgi:hypothetical protein
MQYLVYIMFIVLVGFILWLWQRDKNAETNRLYKWQDDMFDRINSDTIEQYAMTHRIKHDIMVQSMNVPQTRKKTPSIQPESEPAFVHQKR